MSDEQSKCPNCGAESGPREGWQKVRWECGSNIELSEFGDSCHFANEEFKQSDLCKLRQRDQLIAECLQVMKRQEQALKDVVHPLEMLRRSCPDRARLDGEMTVRFIESVGCIQGIAKKALDEDDQKLAALKARAERLKQ